MKKQTAEKEEGEIADTGMRRVLAIYRSCRTQVLDSRILTDERQTGSFSVTKKRWLWLLLFVVISALILVCAFRFDPLVQHWIEEHQNRSVKIFMSNVSRFGDWPTHAALGLAGLGIAYWRGSKKVDPHFRSDASGLRNGRGFRACHQDGNRSCASFGES